MFLSLVILFFVNAVIVAGCISAILYLSHTQENPMSLNGKLDRYSPQSVRAGGYRSEVKRATRRKRRRLDRRVERGDERAEGESVTHGWAD